MESSLSKNQSVKLPNIIRKIGLIGILSSSSLLLCCYYWQNYQQTEETNQQQQYSDNYDSFLTSMMLARHYSDEGDFIAAEKSLQIALSTISECNLHSMLLLCLARVQLQQNNVDSALKNLDDINQPGWQILADDLRGDAMMIKDNHQAARAFYEKVLQANPTLTLQEFVRVKINNIPK